MKFTLAITTLVATAGLAACASAPVHPTAHPATPTPTSTLALAPPPPAAPAPTPATTTTPTAPPTSDPPITVTATCSNVPAQWPYGAAPSPGYPPAAIFATVTWHAVIVGDYLDLGNSPPLVRIISNPFSLTQANSGELGLSFIQGSWDWAIWGSDQATEIAEGTLTVPACPGKPLPTPTPSPSSTPLPPFPVPQITAGCAPDPGDYNWTVILTGQSGQGGGNGGHAYDFDYSTNQTDWTTVNAEPLNFFSTPRSDGDTLYVRWSADHASSTSQQANSTLCSSIKVTVTTTCTTSAGSGTATLAGVTVGDELRVESTYIYPITSNPYTFNDLVVGTYDYEEDMPDGLTEATGGSFTISLCPGHLATP